jgi:hypothetical protein
MSNPPDPVDSPDTEGTPDRFDIWIGQFNRRTGAFFENLWGLTRAGLTGLWRGTVALMNAQLATLRNGVDDRSVPEDGSAHVALSVRSSLIIAVGSLIFSMLLYAILMHHFQSQLRTAIETTPVVRDILDPALGLPLRPMPGFGVSREWETTEPAITDFDDHYPLTASQWLEVLKRLGLVEADNSITLYLGSVSNEEYQPTQALIGKLQDATQGESLGQITPLALLSRLATELDKAGTTSGTSKGLSAPCWASALSQVMAGFPGRWKVLADGVRAGRAAAKEGISQGTGAECPWNANGEFAVQPSFLRYTIFFDNETPNEATLARTLLEGTGALNAGHVEADLPETGTPIDHLQILQKAASSARSPATTPAPVVPSKTTILAEQFARQLLGATMTTADVRRPKLWLDALVGAPQAVLNWFFFMLLAFVIGRMTLLRKMRQEIRLMTAWLDLPKNKTALKESAPKKRANGAERMAAELEQLQRGQESESQLRSTQAPSSAATAEHGVVGARPPQQAGNRAAHDLAVFFGQKDPKWDDIRRHSLIVLMAEKAIRRLIVGEAQPELFREFCAARRAMVDESAWLLRYMARALPALGFVGTILGILFALNGADGIVRASNQAERISAMAAVTGPLAFAFSHTFIALLAGLITGFWIDRETAQERLSLLAYEESLIEKIDLAERDANT